MIQNGRDFLQKNLNALYPLRHRIESVASRQTTAAEPGRSARFNTVRHSNKETGAAGEIGASDWRRK